MRIRYVNGYKIRQFFDPNFGIFHIRRKNSLIFDSKWYIPENEMWCDKNFRDEVNFLSKVEILDLKNRQAINKKFIKKGPIPDFFIKKKVHKNLKISYVDGKIVRQYIDSQFIIGGHDLVYKYVPKNEIWIDVGLDSRDVPHIIIHEIFERNLMKRGKSYDVAHEWATVAEKESRRKSGGAYPGDDNYTYRNLKEIFKIIYVK